MHHTSHRHPDHHMWLGLTLFVIGAVILLQKFELVPKETWGYLWPSILIIIGLKMMSASSCSGENCGIQKPKHESKPGKKRKLAKKK
jgi:hypothetical protein